MEWLPVFLIPILPYLPVKRFVQMRSCHDRMNAISRKLIAAKTEAHLQGLEGGKDLISLLMRGNAKEEASWKLSDAEVTAEIA